MDFRAFETEDFILDQAEQYRKIARMNGSHTRAQRLCALGVDYRQWLGNRPLNLEPSDGDGDFEPKRKKRRQNRAAGIQYREDLGQKPGALPTAMTLPKDWIPMI